MRVFAGCGKRGSVEMVSGVWGMECGDSGGNGQDPGFGYLRTISQRFFPGENSKLKPVL